MIALVARAIVFALLGLGLALVLGGTVAALQWLRVGRRGVAAGPVSLRGPARTADDATTVTAPVSGEAALCHEWRLEREEGRVTRPVWRSVATAGERVPFDLRTDDERIRVDPEAADLDLAEDRVDPLEEPDDVPPPITARLDTLPALDGDDRYRLVERRLEPGDEVAVTGHLSMDAAGRPTVDGPTGQSIVARLFGVPFAVADADRDGGRGRLRDRVIAGFVLGLPPTLLSLVLLFPPELGG